MKRKRWIRVGVLSVLLALTSTAVLTFYTARSEAPRYEGKSLRTWLENYHPTEDRVNWAKVGEAVRFFGTNAVPTLLRMLQANDSPLTRELSALAEKQHLVQIHTIPAELQHFQASMAFRALGTEASNAVPRLIQMYHESDSESSREHIIESLGYIRSSPKLTIPALRSSLDDKSPRVRLSGSESLKYFNEMAGTSGTASFK